MIMMRLNFGAGYVTPKDWTNIDKLDYGGNIVADVLEGLPFPDEHFDYAVANHSLQMIRFDDLPRAFAELRRVLKVGGTLRILVPDIARAIKGFKRRDASYFPIDDSIEPTLSGKTLRYIFWHGDARSAFTFENLQDTLYRNNFQNVRRCSFKRTYSGYSEITSLDSRKEESLIVESIK